MFLQALTEAVEDGRPTAIETIFRHDTTKRHRENGTNWTTFT